MPAPLLPQKKTEALLRAGHSPKEIAEILEREDFIKVTPESISMFRQRRGIPRLRMRHEALIPWTMAPKHANLYPAKMLRLEGRRRAGETLSENQTTELNRWLAKLAREDAVVGYERDGRGWFYTQRRHGIDEDLIRNPEVE